MGLSWLVMHGDAVPWVAFAVFVIGGITLPWGAAFVRAWWTVRTARRASRGGARSHWEEGAELTLSGRLELEGRPCERFEDGAAVAAATVRSRYRAARGSARGERLLLHAGQPVELVGAVEVRVGSREDANGGSLNELGSAVARRVVVVLGVGLDEPVEFSSVQSGDGVRVAGRLERRQFEAPSGGGYREDTRGWQLVPAEAGAPIPLFFEALPRARWPRWRSALMGAFVATALHIAVFWGGGALALQSWALEVAAATPLRETALTRLQQRYEATSLDDTADFERLAAVSSLRGDACGLAGRLRQRGQLDRARRAASDCHDAHASEMLSLCFLRSGRFSEASATLEAWHESGTRRVRADVHVNVHLLAGQPRRALRRLEHLTGLPFPDGVPAEAVALERESRARERCLRAALAVRLDGNEDALARLRDDAASGPAHVACTLLYADLMQGEERIRALDACDRCRKGNAKAVRWLLGVTAACPRHQERSQECQAWLADARRSMENEHWSYDKAEEWLLHADPALENETGAHLMGQLDRRVARVMEAFTWTRDASGIFSQLTAPGSGNAAELLKRAQRTRAEHRALAPEQLEELARALEAVSRERAQAPVPALTPALVESGTCHSPLDWFEGELEPRRMLARLMWTTRAPAEVLDPAERVELWLTIAAFSEALLRRDTAVLLSVLHL